MLWSKFDNHHGKVGCLYCKWRGEKWDVKRGKISYTAKADDWETDICPNCGSSNIHPIIQGNKDLKIDLNKSTSMFPIMSGGHKYVSSLNHTLNYIIDSEFCKTLKITIDDRVYEFDIRKTLHKLSEMGLVKLGKLEDEINECRRERGYW